MRSLLLPAWKAFVARCEQRQAAEREEEAASGLTGTRPLGWNTAKVQGDEHVLHV